MNGSELFRGIDEAEIRMIMPCINARLHTYEKGEYIARSGDTITSVGMVIVGSVQVIDEDFWGNRNILSHVGEGDVFGASYACVPDVRLQASIVAPEPCRVMFMDIRKMACTCTNACSFHQRLSQNLLMQIARKNLMLTEKIGQTSKRTTRDKLLAYLSAQAKKQGASTFDIPFNRQQLADYLSVDRSAMSSELGKLKGEGVIDYRKNRFQLKMPHSL